jgi:hypothetical protein
MLCSPRLALSDFPVRWLIPKGCLAAAGGAPPPEMGPIIRTRSLSAERNGTEWNYGKGLAILEPVMSSLHNSPFARRLVVGVRDAWDRGSEPQTGSQRESGSALHDPRRPGATGSQVSHPSHSSGITLTQGRHFRVRRQRGQKKRV